MEKGQKRVVLVTGASRGIGREIAKEFFGLGYDVVANYNKIHNLSVVNCQLSVPAVAGNLFIDYQCDITCQVSVQKMVDYTLERFGGIDVLVNNAGVAHHGLFTHMTAEDDSRVMGVNILGMMGVSRAVLPHMIDKKSGVIINISSVLGISGASCEVVYSTSKAAVIGFTKALSREVGLSGIRVNCIAPGVMVGTDEQNAMSGQGGMCQDLADEVKKALKEQTSLNKLGRFSDVAKTAAFLASPAANYITGQVLAVDGGWGS